MNIKIILAIVIPTLAFLLGAALLIFVSQTRWNMSWENPLYYRDPKAPRICMCYWMKNAFYVPCQDIPPELLK